MQLFVIRHAIAEDQIPDGEDSTRALTSKGKAKLRRAVDGLRAQGVRFERVLTSPWKRAAQTARLLAPIFDGDPIKTELLAQPPREPLLGLLGEREDTTAVVGHQPWLTQLAAWLAFGEPGFGVSLTLKKAGVLWLDGAPVSGGMRLVAALPPRTLRALR